MANRKQPGKKPRKENRRNANPSGHLIVSEGVKTEVNYFNGFKEEINRKFEGTVESYTIDIHGAGKETIRIIEEIEEIRRRSPNIYEHLWAVFDKDDFPAEHFDNAIHMAQKRGIRVAWSNECIELWFLLHFAYLDIPISREAYYTKLSGEFKKRGGPEKYEKADVNLYEFLKPYQNKAIANARKLRANSDPNVPSSKKNPCTMVDELAGQLIDILSRSDENKDLV